MAEKPMPTAPGLVACEVCMKEIPESVAVSQEGDEYTQHFCGLECYNKWKQQQAAEPAKSNGNDMG